MHDVVDLSHNVPQLISNTISMVITGQLNSKHIVTRMNIGYALDQSQTKH